MARALDAADPRVKRVVAAYTDFHWGYAPEELLHINDPLLPDVAGIGRLIALHVGEEGESELLFPQGKRPHSRSYIAFDPTHPVDRIHLVTPAAHRNRTAAQYARTPKPYRRTLDELARAAGGRQAEHRYPAVRGVYLAPVKEVIYFTSKKGDGPSFYIHEFGEESGVRPDLAADQDGRCWLVGGNYTCPRPGITD